MERGRIFLVLGAFYSRITKITIGNNTVDLNAAAAAQTAGQDAKAIADAVATRIAEELKQAAEAGTFNEELANELINRSAEAGARAQSEATALRAVGAARIRQPPSAPVMVETDDLRALATGLPLPDALLQRLAERALSDDEG